MSTPYGTLWESYWKELPSGFGEAFWDATPEVGAATHLRLFEPYFDKSVPLVDLGCGNGTQTKFLAERFDRVIGVDISESAVEQARVENPAPNVEYFALDVLDQAQVDALREKVGYANVYMRAVIHQLSPEDRIACATALGTLTGERGCVFDQELIKESYGVFERLLAESKDPLPRLARLASHFQVGLKTSAAGAEALDWIFTQAGFQILATDRLELRTSERFADGSELLMPAQYVIARRG